MSAAPSTSTPYPATYDIAYPESLSRLTTFFRLFLLIPIAVLQLLVALGSGFLCGAVVLMLLFRKRYPRVWFDWLLYLQQFSARVSAYSLLLVDEYPSTTDPQRVSVHAQLDEGSLNRFMPLVKWLLALPHFVVLYVLGVASAFVVLFAWFAILVTGRFPRGLHGFVVGVNRWSWRVTAYTSLLSTDRYPPFSLS
jgi:hypothetical protein